MSSLITAPEPLAVEAGAKVLQNGGNAIDAAVTCALVEGVVNPHSCGIGGYAILTLGLANGQMFSIDAPALAGSKVSPAMWEDKVIGPNPFGWGYFLKGKVNDSGYQAICTPGTVKALAKMLERWGSISWAQAIEPAAQIAEAGYMVDERLGMSWKQEKPYQEQSSLLDYILENPEASRIYLKENGKSYNPGEILQKPRLCPYLTSFGPTWSR